MQICINWDNDYCFDPCNGNLGVFFNSADFDQLMDAVRMELGYKPLYCTEDSDSDGWYDFDVYVTENGIVNNEVIATPCYVEGNDSGEMYIIPLTPYVARDMFEDIKRDIEEHGFSISELLKKEAK